MNAIYKRLTPENLRRGGSTYFRMTAPFWLLCGGIAAIALVGLNAFDRMWMALAAHWPGPLRNNVWMTEVLGTLLLVAAAFPGLRAVSAILSQRLDSNELRLRYSLLGSVDRLIRALVCLLAAAVSAFTFFPDSLEARSRFFTVLGIGLLVACLFLALSLYGWMSDQFSDGKTAHGLH